MNVLLFPSLFRQIVNRLLANGECLLGNETIEIDFKLVIEAQPLINLIKDVPGELPANLLLLSLHFDHVFFGHVLVNLIIKLDVFSIKLNVEQSQLFDTLSLQLRNNPVVEFFHFSTIVSVSSANFHDLEISCKSVNIVWRPNIGLNLAFIRPFFIGRSPE